MAKFITSDDNCYTMSAFKKKGAVSSIKGTFHSKGDSHFIFWNKCKYLYHYRFNSWASKSLLVSSVFTGCPGFVSNWSLTNSNTKRKVKHILPLLVSMPLSALQWLISAEKWECHYHNFPFVSHWTADGDLTFNTAYKSFDFTAWPIRMSLTCIL